MKTANQTAAQLVTALELSLGSVEEKPEPGFRTSKEWGAIWDRKTTTTKILIRNHIESGRMAMKTFRVKDIQGRIQVTPHYKAIK